MTAELFKGRGDCLENRDFRVEQSTRGNDSRNALVTIGRVRRDFQPARSASAHAFDSVDETVDQRTPVDSDFGDQGFAVVLKRRNAHRSPRSLPANRFSPVQPHAKADSVLVLTPLKITGTRHVYKQRQPKSQPSAKRLAPARKHRRNGRQSGRIRHLERSLTLVDSGPQLRIGAASEENLDRERVALGDGHVERAVVVITTLVRVRAKRRSRSG